MQFFDKKNKRLVYIEEQASPQYWDRQWDVRNFEKSVRDGTKNKLITHITKKYLPINPTTKVLDGGCGNGQFVYAFHELGYDAYGVDYAPETVARIRASFPKLQVTVSDVRKMDFPNNFFDGYWSIGVIEHFFDGYKPILDEMLRVIRPGGYLFLTFPYFSPLRRFKALLGLYPYFQSNQTSTEHFYQFALNQQVVTQKFENHGFTLIQKLPYAGMKGLKDEVLWMKPVLQRLYDSQNVLAKIFSAGLSLTLSSLSGHSILLVLRKK